MKKKIISITLVFLVAFLAISLSYKPAVAEAQISEVRCPSGDKYSCITNPNWTVYRGKGTTIVITQFY